ncbi:glycine betaine ABC transporter substrate-binding protein [Actinomadura fulvescens]|uniref:Glycine betaine ABC transporter substrate-binding protein n=1 Tax=Actinomadura fulvescens TaxID=46160 RepID=A0ABP6D9W1_9ACTN
MRLLPIAACSLVLVTVTTGCFSSSTTDAKEGSLAKGASLKGATFTVGSKEFTEQLVLCQVTALALRSAGATVREKCGLQGSNTTRAALTSGSIDMYWEYTGTAWINYLKNTKPIDDPARQYQEAAQQDLAKNQVKWLAPAPANNTYAIGVKTSVAQERGIKNLSDYARLAKSDPDKTSTCVASEFAGRNDGWPGLQKAYGFTLPKKAVATLAEGAIFNAIAKRDPCDFGMVTTTDGRIKALALTPITDDKKFFPIYNPALTVRASVHRDNPAIEKVVNPLAAAITDAVLQELNGEVDVKGKEPVEVAEAWLQSKGFIGK